MKLTLALPAILLSAACGDGSTTGGADGGSAPTSGGGGSASTNTGTPIGPGDGAWKTAYSDDAVGMSCDSSLADLMSAGAPMLTSGATTLAVGFRQVGDNQDPVFLRFDDGAKVYCVHHEQEPPDGRAFGLTWDGGPVAYVVFTVVGGGTAFDSLAASGWISNYGDGGGSSKVMVLGAVDTTNGAAQHATFVPAKRQMGTKTNTLGPAGPIVVLEEGSLEIQGRSAFSPLNPDKTVMCVPDVEYPGAFDGADGPNFLARFSSDLTTMLCSSTAGCSNVTTPCD
jgi:hypothetical protein